MKANNAILSVAIAAATLTAVTLSAKDSTQANPFKKPLNSVPVLDLPVKASSIVQKASDADRDTTAASVVQAASELKPASIPVVVAAIAKTSPKQAAAAAAAAAESQPELAAAIVRAAVAAAPGEAHDIVYAVCRKMPSLYQAISMAAAEAAPSARDSILSAVASAIPELAPAVQQASADAKDQPGLSPRPLSRRTKGAPVLVPNFGPLAANPVVGAPFINLPPGPPSEITPGGTHQVPVGQRNYARP